MIEAGKLAYFARTTGTYKPVRAAHNFKKKKPEVALLWGDPVYVIETSSGSAVVSAKGHHLRMPTSHLMNTPLLSVYQIDCGQGDAALVHLPDDRWMMVDAGPAHDWSNSGKIAADFLYWKMFVDQSWKNEFDFNRKAFRIDALVVSHPDYDHYGGFMDMTRFVEEGLLEYGTVFHCGLCRCDGVEPTKYKDGQGMSQLGPIRGKALPEAFVTALIDDFDSVEEYEKAAGSRKWKLAGSYGTWLAKLRSLHGSGVGGLKRVHHGSGHLPGYEPSDGAASVKVLGPVEEAWNGKPALRYLDTAGKQSMAGPSRTRNGQSVVLRLDYEGVRVLLTGDLNFKSQALLLKNVPSVEFRCHVAKACHHGSEDISWTFLQAMSPLATMFSSGDNESYAHPRAKVLGLSGAFGLKVNKGKQEFLGFEEDRYVAPLIYSTELSRSIQLFDPYAVYDSNDKRVTKAEAQAVGRGKDPKKWPRRAFKEWLLGDTMVYGMINVRTDGRKVVMAVLKESESSFQVETFEV